jgi:hypothetical protein
MRWRTALMVIGIQFLAGGCVFTLLAQNYYTTEELVECKALVRVLRNEHVLVASRECGGPVFSCSHEHYGLFATRYTGVSVWWIVDREAQDKVLLTLMEEKQRLPEPHPIIVRFYETENWVLHRDVNGEINGEGRGPEKLLRKAFVR